MKDIDFRLMSDHIGGVSRRDFLKYCGVMAVGMGLPIGAGEQIAEAVANAAKRPPVIWLSAQECTGCSESLLRATHPTLEHLILDLISLDYHETLSTPSGHQAEDARAKSIKENKGKFILVVDGSIPVKDKGVYCMIGGKPALDILKETAADAAAIIAIGSCASWGGVPSAGGNPTGATPVHEIIKEKPVVNIPGCPPNPYNFLSTVLYFVTFKKLPELDDQKRPKFAYGRLIHENCERRPHFDAGRFATAFGDDNHRKGYCLYKLGCKGPETYNNCSTLQFGDTGGGTWPVGIGHPCFGCSQGGVGFQTPLFTKASLHLVTPPDTYPHVVEQQGPGVPIAGIAVAAAA
ncbi:MAG TPA: hydrogenase small subunit, partial [Nitrospirota bacterium]